MNTRYEILIHSMILFTVVAQSVSAAEPDSATRAAKKVKALGTIEPAEVVDVGAQVAGTVTSVRSDYGDKVEAGAILATIDSERYAVMLELAKAGCARAEAEFALAKIQLEHVRAEFKRVQELNDRKAIGDRELDAAEFAYKTAQAHAAVAEASLAECKSKLRAAELDVTHTMIRSPVKGTVIDRRVNRGQTVAGTLNSTGLFLIGDTDKMFVWASVKEADIAKVHKQQAVRFKVDTFPERVFDGKVTQIRLNAAMVKSSVSYTVVIAIADPSGLLPYLTAEVEFE